MRKILLVIVFSLSYLPVHIVSAQNNEKTSQRQINTKHSIVRRIFTNGRVGMGVGLPYGSPFLGLGMQFDISNRLALLVGSTKLAGWMGAVGIRYYPGTTKQRLRPHLSAHAWPYGGAVYVGSDYDAGQKGGVVATCGLGGFGNTKTSDGLIDGLSLLLGFGYGF
tara:strand:+ start:103 stop:597 length:495 start_codon:yes stop_codon:yes gene_type:complete